MSLEDFAKPQEKGSLSFEVGRILDHPDWLTPEQIADIQVILSGQSGEDQGPLDLKQEIEQQIRLVRALRNQVLYPNGTLREGMHAKDAKEVLSASTTLFQTLMRFQKEVDHHARQQLLEDTVLEFLREFPDEKRRKALARLEEMLRKMR